MKGLIVFLLFVIAGSAGYYLYERAMERHDVAERAKQASMEIDYARAERVLREARQRKMSDAIVAHQVIEGMSRYEVHQAWGFEDYRKTSDIPNSWQKAGVYEILIYERDAKGFLGMGVDDTVIVVGKYDNSPPTEAPRSKVY